MVAATDALAVSVRQLRSLIAAPVALAQAIPDVAGRIAAALDFMVTPIGPRVLQKNPERWKAVSPSDKDWAESLYRLNQDAHVRGIGTGTTPGSLRATVPDARSRAGAAATSARSRRRLPPFHVAVAESVTWIFFAIGVVSLIALLAHAWSTWVCPIVFGDHGGLGGAWRRLF